MPYDDNVESVIALITLRHPDAFGQHAGVAFQDYHEWLASLALQDQYPLFRVDLDSALLEADLLLAMRTARFRARVSSQGRVREAVRRLSARAGDTAQRRALEELFPGEGILENRLEQAYKATEGDFNRFERGPATMFGAE